MSANFAMEAKSSASASRNPARRQMPAMTRSTSGRFVLNSSSGCIHLMRGSYKNFSRHVEKRSGPSHSLGMQKEEVMASNRKMFVLSMALTAAMLSAASVRAEQADKYKKAHEPFTAYGMQVRMSVVNP